MTRIDQALAVDALQRIEEVLMELAIAAKNDGDRALDRVLGREDTRLQGLIKMLEKRAAKASVEEIQEVLTEIGFAAEHCGDASLGRALRREDTRVQGLVRMLEKRAIAR